MRVLVVDDMAVFREPIAAALRHHGFETACAVHGREALEIARAQPPDLILLDVAMPEMDGLEFLRHARADASLCDVPIILLTAVTERDYVVKARGLGAQSYMLKSQFSLKELIDRVRKFLNLPPVFDSDPDPSMTPAPAPGSAPGTAPGTAVTPAPTAGSHSGDGEPLPTRPRVRRIIADVDAAMQALLADPDPSLPAEDSSADFEADQTADDIFAQLEASEELKTLLDAASSR